MTYFGSKTINALVKDNIGQNSNETNSENKNNGVTSNPVNLEKTANNLSNNFNINEITNNNICVSNFNTSANPAEENTENLNINLSKKEENPSIPTPMKTIPTILSSFPMNIINKKKECNQENNNNNAISNPQSYEKNLFTFVQKENFTFMQPDIQEIAKYQAKLLAPYVTDNIIKFYSLKGDDMNYSEYYEDMKNYFVDIKKKQRERFFSGIPQATRYNPNQFNKRKIIFIHDSAMQLRSKINFKNKKFRIF